MRREEFEHVIRAAAAIVDDEVVVIGSQAVLGQFPEAPDSLLQSLEVDLFPRSDPDRAHEIDGAIGDGSRFHETYAYYAHGVGPETAIAPAGWEDRLVRVEVPASGPKGDVAVAWCLEVTTSCSRSLPPGGLMTSSSSKRRYELHSSTSTDSSAASSSCRRATGNRQTSG